MRNILIIGIVLVAMAYMFVIMKDKYETMQDTNAKIQQQKKIN